MVIVWTHLPQKPPFNTQTHTHSADTHKLTTHTAQLHTMLHLPLPSNAKHHILLQPNKRFRKRITSAVIPALRWSWEGLLISARCLVGVRWKVYEYWFVFSYLNQSMIWTQSLSALWSGDSETLWWRRSPDVYWRDPDLIHSWGRARRSANVMSRADEARLAASCSSGLGLWTAVLMLTLVGGRFYCILEITCWPWKENFIYFFYQRRAG